MEKTNNNTSKVEFSLLSMEQIINQAAKWLYMSAGKAAVH